MPGGSMTPTRPLGSLGSSRHALESCTLQLHAWKPFQLQPHHPEHPYPFLTKKPCGSDRSTAPNPGDPLDLSKLSLLDDPPHPPHPPQQRHREDGIVWFARKRRRRRGGSRSVSGRSSDRSGTRRRCCSVGGAASGAYATCSDFPVVAGGTDSSGELFMNGDGNWGSDVSEARIPSRRDSKDAGSGGGGLDREASCSAPYQGGLGVLDTQGNESGYGSETGYRGDAEFGYGDEFDEEEDDGRLLFLGHHFGGENKFSDQKTHHRCRRKKHDCPIIDHLR